MTQKTAQNVIRVAVYHRRFADPDNSDEAFDVGRDLGMGYDFAIDHGVDPAAVFDDAYLRAGVVGIKNSEFSDAGAAANHAYSAWEAGEYRDPTATRSMAVGDILFVEGGGAYFVDRIGFQKIGGIDPADVFDA